MRFDDLITEYINHFVRFPESKFVLPNHDKLRKVSLETNVPIEEVFNLVLQDMKRHERELDGDIVIG